METHGAIAKLFANGIEETWTCKDGEPRAFFEWRSATLSEGYEIGRTVYQAFHIGCIWPTLIANRIVPPTQLLDGAVEWFQMQVAVMALKDKATPETHDLYWRARPEVASVEPLDALQFYARLGFAPKDAQIIPTEERP